MVITDYRNAQYNAVGTVDLEVNSELLGWIPITIDVTDADTASHIVQIKNWINANADQISAYIPPTPVMQYKTKFTSLEYLSKFTSAEQEAIASATASNVQLKLFYDKMLAATFVYLGDPVTVAGLDALVAAGFIDNARKVEILTPEVVS